MNYLFEAIDFVENPLYERIIFDISTKQYSIVEDFFNQEDVEMLRHSLLEKYEEDAFKKAAIGNRVHETIVKSIRGDVILWIDEHKNNTAEALFFNKINHLIGYLNKTCFMGILHKEFHYALYPKGTFYKRHIDTFENDDRRKLSFVCYLNNEDWKPENGGELVLYLDYNGIETEKVIYPFPGKVVIFESQIIEHEVKPVNTQRLSITGWLKTR
ncbi:MAG: 2OG-Fe(II) oxygenase [Flavobacteriales bacterium]|nr:2OG-Fe(II) oxygenase [Flavobacteriia bacterium]NCP05830.1 2OG-Fe(II) oxygenase [Flavobacteriales bacterium]PIV94389.1 MAG: oxidoreductase [Flavobacteriaceae bacterium CG17_big_fil_post_rev_8_21_14_2_50_33_15]PIY12392.1 MAG: oxidoreductase [Flavobacteriaceae bacterium CG_4_10_14_3_um_filter_33_47]PJB19509.1 MAG: oxidoreductase [Flavobacteriaceae bacterium CG_4_9_14_3_um_filter_33_16]